MCKGFRVEYTACRHRGYKEALCRKAESRIFHIPCSKMATKEVAREGFCRTCELKLNRNLQEVQRAQERGWEWTPNYMDYGLQPRDSIDEEIERNRVMYLLWLQDRKLEKPK